jgi:hypothetical protein
LISKKYQVIERASITSKKVEKYLVKPRYNESIGHCFLVYDIANYLENKVDNLEIFVANKPDIVFKMNDKKIALEIETGKLLKNNRKQFENKIELLKKNYDTWFIVVTDRNLVTKYSRYGETIDKRYIVSKLDSIIKKGAN